MNTEFNLKIDRAFCVIFGIALLIIILVGVNRGIRKSNEEYRTTPSVENVNAEVKLKDFTGDYLDEDNNELHVSASNDGIEIEMIRTGLRGGDGYLYLIEKRLEGNVLYVYGTDPNGYPYEGKMVLEKDKVTLVCTDSHWGAASDGRMFIFLK